MQSIITKSLMAIFCVFSSLYSQNEIEFKIAFKPETTYKQVSENSIDMKMLMKQADGKYEEMKTENAGMPKMSSKMSTSVLISTGKKADSKLPIKMKTIGFTTDNEAMGDIDDFKNLEVLGHILDNGKLEIDEINHCKTSDEIRQLVTQVVQTAFTNMSLPSRKMKVGETLVHDVPMHLPIPGYDMTMNIKHIYTLKSIKGNIAEFELEQKIGIDNSNSNDALIALMNGTGKGTVSYDIQNQIISYQEMQSTMNMNMDALTGGGFNLQMNDHSKHETTIEK